jgi:hypothetical protein
MLHVEPGMPLGPHTTNILTGVEPVRNEIGVRVSHPDLVILGLPLNHIEQFGLPVVVPPYTVSGGHSDPTLRWGLRIDNSTGSVDYGEVKLPGYALKKRTRILTLQEQRRIAVRNIIE